MINLKTMGIQSKGRIFLAEQRELSQEEWFRSYYTFNFREFFSVHKTACNGVSICNDDTLGGGKELTMTVKEHTHVLLLPVVGNILYKDTDGNRDMLQPGMMQLTTASDFVFQVANASDNSLTNYIQIWIKAVAGIHAPGSCQAYFNLDENKDQLETLDFNDAGSLPLIQIGKFKGRKEAIYKLKDPASNLFIFVIQGAFEVQGRLVHARDGLCLWDNLKEVELEALSNDAILLIIENSFIPAE